MFFLWNKKICVISLSNKDDGYFPYQTKTMCVFLVKQRRWVISLSNKDDGCFPYQIKTMGALLVDARTLSLSSMFNVNVSHVLRVQTWACCLFLLGHICSESFNLPLHTVLRRDKTISFFKMEYCSMEWTKESALF